MKRFFALFLMLGCALSPSFANEKQANALLKQVAQNYEKLGAFSVTCLDSRSTFSVFEENAHATRTRALGRFGTGNRGAIRVEKIDAKGKTLGLELVRLNDGTTFWESIQGRLATKTLASAKNDLGKEAAGNRLFSPSPGLVTLWLLMRNRSLAVTIPGAALGGVTVSKSPNGNSLIVAHGFLDAKKRDNEMMVWLHISKNGFLKKLESRVDLGERTLLLESTFSTPFPFSDPKLLKWESLAPKPNPRFQIEPRAQEILARASKFYGQLDSLQVNIKAVQPDGEQTGTLEWVRRGLLRFENQSTGNLLVIDGTNRWNLWDVNAAEAPLFRTPLKLREKPLETILALRYEQGLGKFAEEFPRLLLGTSVLEDKAAIWQRTRVLASGQIGSETCDVVEVITQIPRETTKKQKTSQRITATYFVASDGRLLRCHRRDEVRTVLAANDEYEFYSPQEFEFDLLEQIPNAAIKSERFRFQKPKNAVYNPNLELLF